VTVFGQLAVLAAERVAVGDHVGVTGCVRVQPLDGNGRPGRMRVDVVAERLDFLGHPAPRPVAPDAHLEAAYDDRFDFDEASSGPPFIPAVSSPPPPLGVERLTRTTILWPTQPSLGCVHERDSVHAG
jgi:hypothetical protein